MHHSPGFLKLVNEMRKHVEEVSVAEARARLTTNPAIVLLDVREAHEWHAAHAVGARHLGKGVLERDIEIRFPDRSTEIIMYCGGGYRSVLTAEVAQRMGYRCVCSLAGGYRAMKLAGWPMSSDPIEGSSG
jgi:rhodanese-related sulfurtransferase